MGGPGGARCILRHQGLWDRSCRCGPDIRDGHDTFVKWLAAAWTSAETEGLADELGITFIGFRELQELQARIWGFEVKR